MVLLFFFKAGRSVITYVWREENYIRKPISSKQNKWLDPSLQIRSNDRMNKCPYALLMSINFFDMSCEWIIPLCHVYFKLMAHETIYFRRFFSFVQLLWERVFPSPTIISVVLCTSTALKTIRKTNVNRRIWYLVLFFIRSLSRSRRR